MGILKNIKDKITLNIDRVITKDIESVPPEIGSLNSEGLEITDERPKEQKETKEEAQEEQKETKEQQVSSDKKEFHAKKRNAVYNMLKEDYGIHVKPQDNDYFNEQLNKEQQKNKVNFDELYIKIEKINAVLDSFEAFKKFNSERISNVSEQIGELRSNIINSERDLKDIERKAVIASDLVKEVQPEKLMTNLQREVSRIDALKTRLDGFEGYYKTLLDEIKDIKSKISIFRGTEEILKLQESIKRDLLDVQKIKTIVEGHSDKVEEIFMEIKSDVSSFNKLDLIIKDLEGSFRDIKKNMEELKVKSETFIVKDELTRVKETINSEILEFDKYLSSVKDRINDLKKADILGGHLIKLIKQNSDDITDLNQKLTLKETFSKGTLNESFILDKINENSVKLHHILEIVDTLSDKVKDINRNKIETSTRDKLSFITHLFKKPVANINEQYVAPKENLNPVINQQENYYSDEIQASTKEDNSKKQIKKKHVKRRKMKYE